MRPIHSISLEEATNLFFGTQEVSSRFVQFYNTLDMRYETLTSNEREDLVNEIKEKIETDLKNVKDPEREEVWFNGWKENLEAFKEKKDLEAITPKFLRTRNPVRLNGDYVVPLNPYFERDISKLLQIFIYDLFVVEEEITNVYEFGCGSGFNLLFLCETYASVIPNLALCGLDFVQSSVDLISELAKHYNYRIEGRLFDMRKPDHNFKIKENSCVFTACSLEQLGTNFIDFVDYVIDQKPKICFHLEPIIENYDLSSSFDRLAIEFHQKRGYLEGLKPYLQQLEKEGIITIEFDKRFKFGSLFHEGYQLITWRVNEE
tara:strand:- start:210 stop:1163 length:954 start_codon:yes stop_codon:yes gene_type:complete